MENMWARANLIIHLDRWIKTNKFLWGKFLVLETCSHGENKVAVATLASRGPYEGVSPIITIRWNVICVIHEIINYTKFLSYILSNSCKSLPGCQFFTAPLRLNLLLLQTGSEVYYFLTKCAPELNDLAPLWSSHFLEMTNATRSDPINCSLTTSVQGNSPFQ